MAFPNRIRLAWNVNVSKKEASVSAGAEKRLEDLQQFTNPGEIWRVGIVGIEDFSLQRCPYTVGGHG